MKMLFSLSCLLFFSLNSLANTAPVPMLRIVNAVQFPEGWGPPNIVISPNGSDVTVILDASESFDADGDPLQYLLGHFGEDSGTGTGDRFFNLPGESGQAIRYSRWSSIESLNCRKVSAWP